MEIIISLRNGEKLNCWVNKLIIGKIHKRHLNIRKFAVYLYKNHYVFSGDSSWQSYKNVDRNTHGRKYGNIWIIILWESLLRFNCQPFVMIFSATLYRTHSMSVRCTFRGVRLEPGLRIAFKPINSSNQANHDKENQSIRNCVSKCNPRNLF